MAFEFNKLNVDLASLAKTLQEFIKNTNVNLLGQALLLLIIGIISATIVSIIVEKALFKNASKHYRFIIKKITYYLVLVLFIIGILQKFNLGSYVWGTAGFFIVFLGLAFKASGANIISGLFLVCERSFVIGDIIEIDEVEGEVLSIDLMSIKLRGYNNSFIRIPNEYLVNTKFKNLSRFAIRRLDISMELSYTENLNMIEKILLQFARLHQDCLESPPANLYFQAFQENSVKCFFSVWIESDKFKALKQKIPLQIHELFTQNNIQFPVKLIKMSS